ncbi:hypothetical protein KUTeg_007765 [Tegillarca granosa]|uniref:YqaJ viral recombinase domain-containing protein n=1 Tax=Tegillarca granosa TaxID=220873 RepID=A0ABQ9FIV0_TEGGR|nr:hypothetical protein KUTeg_007765 [Tegillarca granosa]
MTKSASKMASTNHTDFDPRNSDDKNFEIDWSLRHLSELKIISPNTGMAHLWNIPDEVPEALCTEEMETSIHPLEEKMSQMIINDDVLAAGDSANSLVKMIIDGSNMEKYNRLPEAIQWGIDHERDAKKDNADIKAAICDNFSIKATGLTICTTHYFLGASGDGSATDGTCSGVLEIKCRFSVGGIRVTNMQVSDIIALNDKKFCMENSIEGQD